MYIGYPISLETAFKIFGYRQPMENAQPRYNVLRDHLLKHDLDIYFYDKNVYILGKQVNEFNAVNDTHYTVPDAIDIMVKYNHKITDALKAAGANMLEFDIEVMEGEPQRIKTSHPYIPQPYVIT